MSDKAPQFELLINGKVVEDPLRSYISNIRYTESLTDTSNLRVTFSDFTGFPLTLEDLKLRTPMILRLGYANDLKIVFDGEVIGFGPVGGTDTPVVLEVEAYDRSYLYKKEPKPYIYTAKDFGNLREVVEHIVQEHGLTLELSPAQKLVDYVLTEDQSIEQADETDWSVLDKIARTNHYRLYCKGQTVYMVNDDYIKQHQTFKRIFEYRPSADDFEARIVFPVIDIDLKLDTKGQREKVQIISWKPTGLPTTTVEADDPDTEGDQGYSDIKFQGQTIETIRVPGIVRSEKQAKAYVKAELQRRIENLITGNMVIEGDPTIHFGEKHNIRINGLGEFGKRFSGDYQITDIEHTLTVDKGYRMGIQLRRSGLSR